MRNLYPFSPIFEKIFIEKMKRFLLFFLLGNLLGSCCNEEPEEKEKHGLSGEELKMIPYGLNGQIPFKHSGGHEFEFMVTQNTLKWEKIYDECEWTCCGQDYISYQVKTTVLECPYPNLRLEWNMQALPYMSATGYYQKAIEFNINQRHYLAIGYKAPGQFISDSTSYFHDSLQLNGHIYENVIEKTFGFHTFLDDTSVQKFESIFYNQNKGLLQVNMSNDEKYFLEK